MDEQPPGPAELKVNCSPTFAARLRRSITECIDRGYLIPKNVEHPNSPDRRSARDDEDPTPAKEGPTPSKHGAALATGRRRPDRMVHFPKFPAEIKRMIYGYAIEQHEQAFGVKGRVWPIRWCQPEGAEVQLLGLESGHATPWVIIPQGQELAKYLRRRPPPPFLRVDKIARVFALEHYSVLPVDDGSASCAFKVVLRPEDVVYFIQDGLDLRFMNSDPGKLAKSKRSFKQGHPNSQFREFDPYETHWRLPMTDPGDVERFFRRQGRAFPRRLLMGVPSFLILLKRDLLRCLGLTAPLGASGWEVKQLILTAYEAIWYTGAVLTRAGQVPTLGPSDRLIVSIAGEQVPYAGPFWKAMTLDEQFDRAHDWSEALRKLKQGPVFQAFARNKVEVKYLNTIYGRLLNDNGDRVGILPNLSPERLLYHDHYHATRRAMASTLDVPSASLPSITHAKGTVSLEGSTTTVQLWSRQDAQRVILDNLSGQPRSWFRGNQPPWQYSLAIETKDHELETTECGKELLGSAA